MPRLLRLSDVRQTAVDVAPPGYRLARVGLLDLQRITGLSFVGLLVALPLFLLLSGPPSGPEILGADVRGPGQLHSGVRTRSRQSPLILPSSSRGPG